MCLDRTSPSANSASASRVASSADAPPEISSRQRSSRCNESSSTISISRVAERRSRATRGRMCAAQPGADWSRMFARRDTPHCLHECSPRLFLLCQHPTAFGGYIIKTAATFVRLLDPGALDPSTLFEPIQERIQRIDVEREASARSCVNQLAELVPVPRAGIEQRQDEQLCRALLQLALEGTVVDTCHRQILCKQSLRSQIGGRRVPADAFMVAPPPLSLLFLCDRMNRPARPVIVFGAALVFVVVVSLVIRFSGRRPVEIA